MTNETLAVKKIAAIREAINLLYAAVDLVRDNPRGADEQIDIVVDELLKFAKWTMNDCPDCQTHRKLGATFCFSCMRTFSPK